MYLYYIYYGSAIILIPGIIFSIWAQFRISSTFKKYSKVESRSRWTADEMSMMLLERYNCHGVSVRRISGNLSDNYNPSTNVLSLSETVHGKTSISALGVAAHECGHALQKHSGSALLALRSWLVPITNIGTRLAVPVAILGVILEAILSTSGTNFGSYIIAVGVLMYSLTTVFSLVTLPVEIDASKKALRMMTETGVLEKDEIKKARSVLYSAALTYVASLVVSFLYLLRFLSILARFRRRD